MPLPREETTPPVMNTYRAMGFTGYLFTSDSASPNFMLLQFAVDEFTIQLAGMRTKENRQAFGLPER
jgi:hypothetical protein